MNDFDEQADDEFDRDVRRHLGATLDGHLGRAERAFRGRPRSRRWTIALATAGSLAAAIAVTWAVVGRRPAASTGGGDVAISSTRPQAVEPGRPEPTERAIVYTTADEGTVVLAGQGPARQLRRTVVETYQYYDPKDQGQIEITVPREQTVLVGMQTY